MMVMVMASQSVYEMGTNVDERTDDGPHGGDDACSF
jgi:hypothetical protein